MKMLSTFLNHLKTETIIGPRNWAVQNNTIEDRAGNTGLPIIGSGSRIYTSTVISEPIKLGNHVSTGANTIVFQYLADGISARPGNQLFLAPLSIC